MKIIELVSENFKRLSAVSIKPDGSLVVVAGKNGQGKTSILDSIYAALAGKSAIQSKPIRTGQKKAKIRLDMGELIVTREFRATKDGDGFTTSLTVESPDGGIHRSPQKMLDDLLGELTFDPLSFSRASAKDQVDMLRALVPDFDFDEADRLNAADYDKRRDVNRQAKERRAQIEAIDVPAETIEPIDESELVTKLEQAGEHNAEIERRKAKREQAERDAKDLDDEAERHRARAAELRRQADAADTDAKAADNAAATLRKKLAEAPELPEPVNTHELREQIDAAKTHNAKASEIARRAELEREAEALEEKSEALSEAMNERNESKAKAIAAAKLPIEGLTFGSGEVQLAGVPFEQASDAEQLRASVAIAMALNPKVRVVRIRDGSLLDEDSMKLLGEMLDANDYQCWLERVDSSGKVGFVIEDGHVRAEAEQQPEAATA